jgi:hypothetical protein
VIRLDIAFLLVVGLLGWWSILRDRRAHDQELFEKRIRHYQGGDL